MKRADLPYLDVIDQRHVIHCLLVLVMRSVRSPRRDVADLTALQTHILILDVFVKSTLDIFSDESQRRELVERIEGYVDHVPFLPAALLEHAIERFCEKACDIVTPVLIESYNEHLRCTDIYAMQACAASEGLERGASPQSSAAPKSSSLRRPISASTEYPRRGRGAAATRFCGISAWQPRRRRDPAAKCLQADHQRPPPSRARSHRFTTRLRSNLIAAIDPARSENHGAFSRVVAALPDAQRARYISFFVDAFLESLRPAAAPKSPASEGISMLAVAASTEYPRRRRGAAATRLRGRPPRR